jgi:hypothetical protein
MATLEINGKTLHIQVKNDAAGVLVYVARSKDFPEGFDEDIATAGRLVRIDRDGNMRLSYGYNSEFGLKSEETSG